MRLNIEAIITAERLLKRPFLSMDFTNSDVLKILVYSTYVASGETMTLKDFTTIWDIPKERVKLIKFILNEMDFLRQFDLPTGSQTIESMVMKLARYGLSPYYLMQQMKPYDIAGMIEAFNGVKESPHMDIEYARNLIDKFIKRSES